MMYVFCVHVCTQEQRYFLEVSFSRFPWQTRPSLPPVIPDPMVLEKEGVLCLSQVSGTTSLQILSHFYISAPDTFASQSTSLSHSLSYCHIKSRPSIVDIDNWVLKNESQELCYG